MRCHIIGIVFITHLFDGYNSEKKSIVLAVGYKIYLLFYIEIYTDFIHVFTLFIKNNSFDQWLIYKTITRFYTGAITIYIGLFVSSRSTYAFVIILLCIRNACFISTELSLTMNTLFIGTNLPLVIFEFFFSA